MQPCALEDSTLSLSGRKAVKTQRESRGEISTRNSKGGPGATAFGSTSAVGGGVSEANAAGWRAQWPLRPSLDGLRALAVIAVVCFHFAPGLAPGGFIGVDVFFVLSGYLISGMLVVEKRVTGKVDLASFWWRRACRLIPAVLLLVTVCSIAVWATNTGSQRGLFHSLGALTWSTNLIELQFGGTRPWLWNSRTVLDHLWSLANEEQFYLLWPPILVFLLGRVQSTRGRLAGVGLLSALSIWVMATIPHGEAYFRPDARAFELLSGAALALGGWRVPQSARTAVAAAGFGALVAFTLWGDPRADWMYPAGFVLSSVMVVVVLMAVLDPPPGAGAVLSSRALQYVGKRSYGIYLWHIPVLRIVSERRLGFGGVALLAIQLLLVWCIAAGSYRFLEQPLRRGVLPNGSRLRAQHLLLGYVATLLSLLLFIGPVRSDLRGQWNLLTQPPTAGPSEVKVLVLGDLLGGAVAAELESAEGVAVWDGTAPSCWYVEAVELSTVTAPVPVDPICSRWKQRWRDAISRFKPDRILLATGFWDQFPMSAGGRPLDLVARQTKYAEFWNDALELVYDSDAAVTVLQIEDWRPLIKADQQTDEALTQITPLFNTQLDETVPSEEQFDASFESWSELPEVVTGPLLDLLQEPPGPR